MASSEIITKDDLEAILAKTILLYYPVGSYYETSDGTFDPNIKWGGNWELETQGQVHVSAGSNYTVSGALSNTTDGGSKDAVVVSHTHTMAHTHDMAHTHSHNHVASGYISANASSGSSKATPCGRTNENRSGTYTTDTDATPASRTATGASTAANTGGASGAVAGTNKNMPPYINVYRWHRTA